ncbi:MAG: hypothetical protein R3B70_42410 [Polyangiaceae bacterium]
MTPAPARGRPPKAPAVSLLRVALALVLACAALLAGGQLRADGLRVLLIGPSASDPTVTRVRQELSLLGLEVDVIAPAPPDSLADLAHAHGAAAVARVDTSPPEILLWVDEAHSAGTPQGSRVSESMSGAADPALLALRAVELLRGRLLPVPDGPPLPTSTADNPSLPPTATSTLPSPPPTATATLAPTATATLAPTSTAALPTSPRRFHVHAGPALAASPGGVPPMAAVRLGASFTIGGPVEVGALLMLPLSAGTVAAPEGEMDLRVFSIAATAAARFSPPVPHLSLLAGAGLGAAGFLFEGHALAPYEGTSADRWTALPFVEVGAAYRFTPLLALRADLLAAFAAPRPVLVIANREVADYGLPALLFSISLEVSP